MRGGTAWLVPSAFAVIVAATPGLAHAQDATAPAATAPAPTGKPAPKKIDNDDLIRQASSLLDPVDVRPKAPRRPVVPSGRPDAAPSAAPEKGVPEGAVDVRVAPAPTAKDGAAPEAGVAPPPVDAAPVVAPAAAPDSAPPVVAAPVSPLPQEAVAPVESVEPPPPFAVGRAARAQRVASGRNVDPEGPKNSPLAKVGIPLKAVPIVATVATVGAMALWPFLIKTLTGLLKGIVGGLLKNRAKKDKKVDATLFAFDVAGFKLRPAELGALGVAALTYGLAVCYTLQGWKMRIPFVTSQELLIVAIYFSRSLVRFVYERAFKLTTQYKFWPGGGLLCLGSAYLGNTLGTVGFEVEATTKPEDAQRIVKMKAWLIVLALAMALAFFTANIMSPAKVLQSGRIMLSGMALGEIMPITPMPGLKIYRWNSTVWAVLFLAVIFTFFMINFVL